MNIAEATAALIFPSVPRTGPVTKEECVISTPFELTTLPGQKVHFLLKRENKDDGYHWLAWETLPGGKFMIYQHLSSHIHTWEEVHRCIRSQLFYLLRDDQLVGGLTGPMVFPLLDESVASDGPIEPPASPHRLNAQSLVVKNSAGDHCAHCGPDERVIVSVYLDTDLRGRLACAIHGWLEYDLWHTPLASWSDLRSILRRTYQNWLEFGWIR